jgi:hypothetical protein
MIPTGARRVDAEVRPVARLISPDQVIARGLITFDHPPRRCSERRRNYSRYRLALGVQVAGVMAATRRIRMRPLTRQTTLRKLAGTFFVTAIVGLAASAQASDSIVCGAASAGWNAPKGAAVTTSSSSGVVSSILGQLGETYSHVMLSHGPISGHVRMSHASMATPRAMAYNTADDDWFLPDITMSNPGAATVGMAAAYAYLYQQSEGPVATAVYVDGGAQGIAASDALLNLPLCSAVSAGKCRIPITDPTCSTQCSTGASNRLKYGNTATYVPYGAVAEARDLIGFKDAATGVVYRMSYGVYTFTNDYLIPEGIQQSTPYAGINCSLFMAMASNWAGNGTMTSYAYTGTPVANATQELYNVISQMVGAAGGNATAKSRLGNQMVNCFTAADKCTDMTATPWTAFKSSGTAVTISPDRIRGLGVHSAVVSPWKGTAATVQWNAAGGNVYGCWGVTPYDDQYYSTVSGWNNVTGSGGGTTCTPACGTGYTCQNGTCVANPVCTPVCNDNCGQANGCGGTCPSTDATACGKCGNAPCGGSTCAEVSVQNLGISSGTWKHYTITGTNVTANLSGGTGDGDLYLKLGSAPTTSSYGCRSYGSTNTESCTLAGTGTFYVSVYAYSAVAATNLRATVASCSSCAPDCGVALCGQADGCGGTCAATDAQKCGMCGNPACCTPTCTGDLCGQPNGCTSGRVGGEIAGTGGVCPNTDAATCGKCGNAACGGGSCGTIAYTCSASTASCTYSDSDTRWTKVNLTAGTAYTFSTCAGTVDTYLKLYDGSTVKVSNDDGCTSGYGSKMTFTPTTSKVYDLYMGFYSTKTGSSTVSISPAPSSCTTQR